MSCNLLEIILMIESRLSGSHGLDSSPAEYKIEHARTFNM